MGQISGAIIGVTVVLVSVFVPLAFFSGSVGNIYRQFAAVMGVSIAFSAFMALSLTPALCATLLKPVEAGHHHAKTGFFGWFNRGFSRTAKGYEGVVARILPRAARYLVIYVAIVAARWWCTCACRPRSCPTRTRATCSSTCSCRRVPRRNARWR
jgi:multidrug efflux pump